MLLPVLLYYNCDEPIKILESGVILPSKRIVGGISMSAWRELGSHGPFKICFRRSLWFEHFKKVEYGPPPLKNPMFEDEQEWHCEAPVKFKMTEVAWVMFMTNAPCPHIGTRKLARMKDSIRHQWPMLYIEGAVNDPYLQRLRA